MRTGRPKKPLELSSQEREKLEMLARRPKTSQRLALRARIVLRCADGRTNRDVARDLHVNEKTVSKWRERFRVERLEGLCDQPRPGAPRTILDHKVEDVVTKTLETTPKGATHWSTRTMAKAAGISDHSVRRIWHAFGLKPHRQKTFKLSTDPFFTEKTRDLVGLYLDPPDNAVVFCIDEKSQIQALDRSNPLLPMEMDYPEARTHDYVRHGTTSLFAALDVATGDVIGACHRRHRHQEFLKFLRQVETNVPAGVEVHLILDNYGTHKTPKVQRWLAKRPHWHVHFTPTGASWLNLAERWFAEITCRRIRRGTFRSVRALERAIREYLDTHNESPKPFVWTATAEEIFGKIYRLCERISHAGH